MYIMMIRFTSTDGMLEGGLVALSDLLFKLTQYSRDTTAAITLSLANLHRWICMHDGSLMREQDKEIVIE